jgi:hypothetical protein
MVGATFLLFAGIIGMVSAANLSQMEQPGKIMYQDKDFS